MMNTWLAAAASILLGSAGQLLLKRGLRAVGTADLRMLLQPFVLLGIAAYAASMLFWLLALRRLEVSLLYPFVSLSYVLVGIGAALWLGESLSITRIAGMGVIILGVAILARS